MQEKIQSDVTMKGKIKLTLRNVITGEIQVEEHDNLIITLGKNSLASRLIGNDTGKITFCALGTDNTSPDVSDTALNTEIFRKQISSRSVTGNVASFRTFYNTTEANGTLREAGLFGDDATATTDSGTLFAHTLITKTKTSSDTLTVDWELTIS